MVMFDEPVMPLTPLHDDDLIVEIEYWIHEKNVMIEIIQMAIDVVQLVEGLQLDDDDDLHDDEVELHDEDIIVEIEI